MATRFYLPSSGAAAVSPSLAAWDETAAAGARLRCVTTKSNTAPASVTVAKGTGVTRALVRQYVSDPISAQTIAAGTVTGQIRALESAANDNLDLVSICIKVVSNDGATLRGTILALGDYAPVLEFGTVLTNRKIADGDATTSVVAQLNDRIVIELGFKNSTTGASVSGDLSFGDNSATDLAIDTTTTAANNPWVELSSTITFSSPKEVLPGTGALVLGGCVPTIAISNNIVVAAALGALLLSGCAPTVTTSNNQNVAAGAGALTYAGFAPSVSVGGGGGGGVAPVLLNSTSSGNLQPAAATNPITIPATTAGSAMVVSFASYDPTNNVASISMGAASFTKVSQSNATRNAEIWVALNIPGGLTGITVNLNATGAGSAGFTVREWAGVDTVAAAVDATNNTNASSTTTTVAPVTPTAGRAAVVIGALRIGGTYASGPDNGFSGSGNGASWDAYRAIASASGSYGTTITTSVAGRWDAAGIALLAPAGGVGPGTGVLSLEGRAPTVSVGAGGGTAASPGAGVVTYTGYAPTVSGGRAFFRSIVADVASTRGGLWGTDAINATCQVYVPSTAAIAAKNWQGLPFRVEVHLVGDGERGTDGTIQMTGGGSRGQQLGWGAAADGSLANPDQNWPTIVIFPPRAATWTGDAGISAFAAGVRITAQIIQRALAVVGALYPLDLGHVVGTGLSGGSLFLHAFGSYYPTLFSALVLTAGYAESSYFDSFPGVSVVTEAAAAAASASALANVPIWMFNSTADTTITPTIYNVTKNAFVAQPQAKFSFYESTTYDHGTTWTKAFLDDGTGNWTPSLAAGALWSAVLAQNHPLGVAQLLLTGYAPTVQTPRNVVPGVGALAYAGQAPTVAVSNNRNVLAGVGAVTYSGFAPIFVLGVNAYPGAGALTLAGLAPSVSVSDNKNVLAGAGVLSLTGLAPSVVVGVRAFPGTGALTYAGLAPSVAVSNNQNVLAGSGALSLAGFAPTIQTPRNVLAGTGALSYVGLAPTVAISNNQNVLAGRGVLTLSGFAPTIALSDNKNVLAGAGALVLAGLAPSVVIGVHVYPGAAALTYSGLAPSITISNNQNVLAGVGALTFAGFAPAAVVDVRPAPATGVLALTGMAPAVAITNNIAVTPGASSLVFTGFGPVVAITNHRNVLAGVGALTYAGQAPVVQTGNNRIAQPGTGALLLTGRAPAVAVSNNQAVLSGTGAITFSGFAPNVVATAHRIVLPGTGQLAYAGLAPTISASGAQVVQTATGALVLLGFAPGITVSANVQAAPATGLLLFSGFAPTAFGADARVVATATGLLLLAGHAPAVVVSDIRVVAPGAGLLMLAGLAPAVSISDNRFVFPGAGLLALLGFAPLVTTTAHRVVLAGVGALVLTGYAPFLGIAGPATPLDGIASIGAKLRGVAKIAARLSGIADVGPLLSGVAIISPS